MLSFGENHTSDWQHSVHETHTSELSDDQHDQHDNTDHMQQPDTDIGRDVRVSDCELERSEARLVPAAAGLEQYIALDRPDTAYSVKTALQQMSKPTKLLQLRVVRVGRYLKNNPRSAATEEN